jgi:endonuclease/exonuclease/phosphatase family metal-dependent hydrolase
VLTPRPAWSSRAGVGDAWQPRLGEDPVEPSLPGVFCPLRVNAAGEEVVAGDHGAGEPAEEAIQRVVRPHAEPDLLGPGYHVVHQGDREADGSGVSIASRWPLTGVREVDLNVTSRTADFPCVSLLAEVEAPAPFGPLLFANHLPNYQLDFEYERELQTVAAAVAIEEAVRGRDVHVVVAGDLDAIPEAASLRFWRGLQSLGGMSVAYRDAWEHVHPGDPGHTVTPRNPLLSEGTWPLERGRRIDYLLVRCGGHGHGPTLDIVACSRLFDEPVDGVWASDHFGVIADLTVAPQPPVTNR